MKKLEKIISNVNSLERDELKKALIDLNADIEELVLLKHAFSKWPYAIDPGVVCKTDKHKLTRAKNILKYLSVTWTKETKFLDFGCGEGHFVRFLDGQVKMAMGYDPIKQWDDNSNLTTNIEDLDGHKFDKIVLCDVLDHSDNPVAAMKTVVQLLDFGGSIHVRCHPWVSRHGGHNLKFNKAFAHLVFSESDLKDEFNSTVPEPHVVKQKVLLPKQTYQQWFYQANLRIINQKILYENVPFKISTPEIKNRVKKNLGTNRYPENLMKISFIDFVLVQV